MNKYNDAVMEVFVLVLYIHGVDEAGIRAFVGVEVREEVLVVDLGAGPRRMELFKCCSLRVISLFDCACSRALFSWMYIYICRRDMTILVTLE